MTTGDFGDTSQSTSQPTYYSDDWLTIFEGDCREVMSTMEPEAVHCVVTSPPYWGLRDYGTATWLGGDEGCDHSSAGPSKDDAADALRRKATYQAEGRSTGQHGGWEGRAWRADGSRVCKCGAVRQDSQLGLEPTPEAYVESMVAVFREVKRVLRHDGTVWLNIGDSYASSAVSVQRMRPDDGRAWTSEGDVPEVLPPNGAAPLERSQPGAGAPEGGGLPQGQQGTPERADHRTAPGLPHGGDGAAGLEMSVLRRDDASTPDARPRPERRLQGPQNSSASDLQAGPGRGLSAGPLSDPLLELQRGEGARGMPTFGGLKQKDLVGIPWMLAFALRADGWYLRSDIIWAKPNPMPESVTDRPTKAHEYLFLLSKSPRYYYDADAVREPMAESSIQRINQPTFDKQTGGEKDYANGTNPNRSARKALENFAAGRRSDHMAGTPRNDGDRWREVDGGAAARGSGRNLRSVWSVATQPYPGAHFATFPEKLVEPCVLAGCPEGGTVLDPFAGSGTVGRVAARLSRRAVLIDLNADYLGQAMRRNQDIPLGLESA